MSICLGHEFSASAKKELAWDVLENITYGNLTRTVRLGRNIGLLEIEVTCSGKDKQILAYFPAIRRLGQEGLDILDVARVSQISEKMAHRLVHH